MGGDLTNNCPLQLLMTYQSARNTQKIPKHFIIILCYILSILLQLKSIFTTDGCIGQCHVNKILT